MRKISVILLIIFFAAIFIRGFFVNRKEFKAQINGIVLNKNEGSKGSVVLIIKPSPNLDSVEFSFTGRKLYDSIKIGDSLVKNANSYSLYLYKKYRNNFRLNDSMEIIHW